MTIVAPRVSIEPFVVRKRRMNVLVACITLALVVVAFASHWDDLATGGFTSPLLASMVIASVGLGVSFWAAALSPQLTVRGNHVESANGLTGHGRAVHQLDDITRCFVYRKISGGVGYAQADRWTVRLEYRDGQYDDVDAGARNADRLVAYLVERGVPRVDAPPAEDEQSTSAWASSSDRTGTHVIVRFCAATLTVVAVAALLFFVRDVQAARRSSSWPTVAGRITYSAVRSDGGSSSSVTYWPVVRYEYQVGGRLYHGARIGFGENRTPDSTLARATSARYAAGTTVTVHYDPGKPASAVLGLTPDPMRWRDVVLSLAIICFGLYGLLVRIPPYRQAPL